VKNKDLQLPEDLPEDLPEGGSGNCSGKSSGNFKSLAHKGNPAKLPEKAPRVRARACAGARECCVKCVRAGERV
jgi:hypothetical protein